METTAPRPRFTGGNVTIAEPLGQSHRIARHLFRILALAFVTGIAAQLLIVGIALFVDGSRWNLHQALGHSMVLLPPVMLIAAFAGRMSRTAKLISLALILLITFQLVSGITGSWAGAIHPLNALAMFGIGTALHRRTLGENVDAPGAQREMEAAQT